MSATAGGHEGTATQTAGERLGLKTGMVVQELGWDEDVDDGLRAEIEDTIDADMVDGDYGNVVDAVLLWWRGDDGDLVARQDADVVFAHFSGDMREHHVIVRELDAEHGAGQNGHHSTFQFDCFFRVHI